MDKELTWYKWFFTDKGKLAVIGMSIVLHMIILFRIEEFFIMPLFHMMMCAFLLDIGAVLIIIHSIFDWKNNKDKYKKLKKW